MSLNREAYVVAARHAAELLALPEVAQAWDQPSALPKLDVGGLAAHLAKQVLNGPVVLGLPVPTEPPVGLLDHYARVTWINVDLDHEANVAVREAGRREAAAGPAAIAARTAESAAQLPGLLAAEPADRVVPLPWAGWQLTLDDFIVTRVMEIAVHADDLAVSVGVDPPTLAEPAFGLTLDLLSSLAVRRHGQAAVLRALARAERAPAAINAM